MRKKPFIALETKTILQVVSEFYDFFFSYIHYLRYKPFYLYGKHFSICSVQNIINFTKRSLLEKWNIMSHKSKLNF